MRGSDPSADFERQMLPHLDAAYRLALWLVRDAATAEDVVQDAFLRAFKAWDRFVPGNARAWLFVIVRRQAYSGLKRTRGWVDIDDETALSPADAATLSYGETQESGMIRTQSADALRAALEALPVAYREVILLKDIEDMPYKTIATILDIPIGTVMSRLARGRELLRARLSGDLAGSTI